MLSVAVGFYILGMGVERRVDIQLVTLKHTESISELEFIQGLMINLKKKIHGLFWVYFVKTFIYEHSAKST